MMGFSMTVVEKNTKVFYKTFLEILLLKHTNYPNDHYINTYPNCQNLFMTK